MYKEECFIINVKGRKNIEKVLNKLDKAYEVLFRAPQTFAYTDQLRIAKDKVTEDLTSACIMVAPEEVYIEDSINDIKLDLYLKDFYFVTFISGYNGLIDTLSYLEDNVVVNHCKNLCSCMKKLNEVEGVE